MNYDSDDSWRKAIKRTDRCADLSPHFGSFTAPRSRIVDPMPFKLTLPDGTTVAAQWWASGPGACSYVAASDGNTYTIPNRDLGGKDDDRKRRLWGIPT